MSTVSVESSATGWSTVHLTGDLSVEDVAQTADIYEALYRNGIRRVMIDARKTHTDYKNLLNFQQRFHDALGKFEKIALLVKDAEDAFSLKTLAMNNPKAHVTYSLEEATIWLQLP
jgi:hypothetical protein